jgi:hypothetical protein
MGTRLLSNVRCVGTSTALVALMLASAGSMSCDEDTVYPGTVDYAYEYYYPSAYYYPADLAYSSYYWSDAWLYDDYYYQTTGSGTGDTARASVGNFLRSLARGEAVCPNQVTVTPHMVAPACETQDTTSIRSGGTIVFNGCQTANGKLDGTVDIQASRTASEMVCSANTMITLTHTSTITNLTFTGNDGKRLVIPSQVDTGTNTYLYNQTPTTTSINTSGRLQLFASDGRLVTDQNHNGTRSITFSAADHTYSVSGTINTQDATQPGSTATLVGTDVKRTMGCCHPTGGMLTVNRTGGNSPGQHTWTFGPGCGDATYDGTAIATPACL